MRILFDNGTPRGVASALPGHTEEEARSHGWDMRRDEEERRIEPVIRTAFRPG
jgi:hypothetical protein